MTAVSKGACLFFVLSASLFAQHLDFGFDFGVKGGVPFTDVLTATGTINPSNTFIKRSDDYLIGPVAELRLPFGFALEVDGIYRGSQYQVTTNSIPSGSQVGMVNTTNINAQAWEIPYLAKFRFPIPLLKPFISAGGAYRSFTNLPNEIAPTHNAFVLAGGLELRISRLRLSGEARWLRWGSNPSTNTLVRLAQNQGEVLFGFVF